MRLKIITALILLTLFVTTFSAQMTRVVKAAHLPVSGPVTGPVTGPLTGPASLFTISGNVTYHLLGMLARGAARFLPASGVTITAVDYFNNHTVSTTTDASGNYSLPVGQSGYYTVTVSGTQNSILVPPFRFVPVKQPSGKKNVSFQGLIFKF